VTINRGVKIRLEPTPEQAKVMDGWRRESISLWNLLLGMQQAAYDGSKFRPELRWRVLWAQIVRDDHLAASHVWKYGKKTKAGVIKKKPGEGKEPIAPTEEHFRKIKGGYVDGKPPGLFIWDDTLQKIMARLKQHELTSWVDVLPSHSSQQVCKDVCEAIRTMLRERKKRLACGEGQNTGFPRFKKQRYAAGSVYMVNSQTTFDHDAWEVKLPKLKTAVTFRQESVPRDGKLLGGRVWRQGEQWWLSCQFAIPAPELLPKTGRECGLKISATILATTFDGEILQQTPPMVEDKKVARRIKLAGRRLARRNKGTKDYYKTAAETARLHAMDRNRRDDVLHKVSRAIVNQFDTITVHKTEVKHLMKKKKFDAATGDMKRTPKNLLRINRRAAMSKFRTYTKYKAVDGGKSYNETHTYFPEVQKCSGCGRLHYMPLDKRVLKCDCGVIVGRQANAAINEFGQGLIVKEATG
jgi:putative transposase